MVLVKNSRDRQKNMIERIHIRTGTMFHNSVCVLFNESLRFSPTFFTEQCGDQGGPVPRFPGPFTNSNKNFLISSARAYSENTHFTGRLRPGLEMCYHYFIFIESKSKVNTHANQVTVEQIEAEAFQREPDSLNKSSKTL